MLLLPHMIRMVWMPFTAGTWKTTRSHQIEIEKQRKKKNGKKWREVNKRGVYGRDMLKLTQRIFMSTNTYFKFDSSMYAISEKWHKVNLCIWDARIFIKYSWQSLGQSGCFGENIKFSNVTLQGNPCCLEDELRKIEKSLAFNKSTYMYTCTHV